MPQVWTSLFDTGVNGNNDEARDNARRGIFKMIEDVDGDDEHDILTSDKIVAFLARAFEDRWKDAASVFDLLEDTKKSQVRVVALCAAMRTLPLTDCALACLCHRL